MAWRNCAAGARARAHERHVLECLDDGEEQLVNVDEPALVGRFLARLHQPLRVGAQVPVADHADRLGGREIDARVVQRAEERAVGHGEALAHLVGEERGDEGEDDVHPPGRWHVLQ